MESTINREGIVMHPAFLTSDMKDKFYDGFCNSVLWPLFLYFPSYVIYKPEFYKEYEKSNELMCKTILEVYKPGDTVWIHDYHWMLLPALLRKAVPDARIGFFLHIPFPSFELYRLLPKPWRIRILLGLMGADVIGFQTDDIAKNFIDSVERSMSLMSREDGMLILKDRPTLIRCNPISIDFEKFNIASKTPEIRKHVRRIRNRLGPTRLVLSVDRLDYTKAIINRLEGFELFLEQNAEFREKVSYVLLMVPTRESIIKYKENKLNVEALISRINGSYGTIGWTPVVYQYKSSDFKRLVALYAASEIALIVPARDGMNLVAKEYVASKPEGDGVLILSETAGAADELTGAILVNPNDRQEIADAILEGLIMSKEEKKARLNRMQDHISKNDVISWASGFLDSINKVINHEEIEI